MTVHFSLILLFVLSFNCAIAQDMQVDARIDSLLSKAAYYQSTQTDTAIYYAAEALKLADEGSEKQGNAYWRLGNIHYVAGNYETSLSNYLESYKIFEERKDKQGLANASNGLGLISMSNHEWKQAIQYFQNAYLINKELGNIFSVSKNLFNLGICFEEMNQLDSAKSFYEQSIQFAFASNNLHQRLMSCNRMGEIYFKNKQYDSAIYYYQINLTDSLNATVWEKTYSHAGLAQTYLALNKLELSIDHAQTALELAKQVRALWDASRAAGILANAYNAKNEYRKAFETHKFFKSLSDSLYNLEKTREMNRLLFINAELENQKLIYENRQISEIALKRKTQNIIYIAAIVLLLFFTLMLYRWINIRKSLIQQLNHKNQEIANQNTQLIFLNQTKNKLFSIISHDLKSPLSTLQSLFGLLVSDKVSQEDQKKYIKLTYDQVIKTNNLLNNLLDWAKLQFEGIRTDKSKVDLSKTVTYVLDSFLIQMNEKQLLLQHDVKIGQITIHVDAYHLEIMLRNLISNAVKFSPTGAKLIIQYIDLATQVQLEIIDYGKGMSETKLNDIRFGTRFQSEKGTLGEEGTGLGLFLVQELAIRNNVNFQINSELGKGTTFSLTFDKFAEKAD